MPLLNIPSAADAVCSDSPPRPRFCLSDVRRAVYGIGYSVVSSSVDARPLTASAEPHRRRWSVEIVIRLCVESARTFYVLGLQGVRNSAKPQSIAARCKDEGVRSAERLPASSRLGGCTEPSPSYGSLPLAVHTHTHGLRPFRLRCLFIAVASPSNFFLPPASGAWLARSGTTNS